jgi:hypothetical protein
MVGRTARVVLVCSILGLAPAIADDGEVKAVDQHLEWSRRIDRAPDPDATGSVASGYDVRIDVRQRQCLPAREASDQGGSPGADPDVC